VIRVTLEGAAVGTGAAAALPPVTASFAAGTPTLLETEGGTRPTVLSLVASGRMRLDAGAVTAVRIDADGREHALRAAELRRAVALIDTPLVAEHSDDVSVASVVKEELALARSHRRADRPAAYADKVPFGSLGAVERLSLLIDLALRRSDVEALVITSPERHGGDPALWWRLVRETAARGGVDGRGVAVLVVTDHATVAHLRTLPHPDSLGRDAVPLFDLESRSA
jgi:ABC-2 type transport system ATP-binding protein